MSNEKTDDVHKAWTDSELTEKIKRYVNTKSFESFFIDRHQGCKNSHVHRKWLFDFMKTYSCEEELTAQQIAVYFDKTTRDIRQKLNSFPSYIPVNKSVTPYVYSLNRSKIQTLIADYEKTLPQTTTDASQTSDTSSNTETRSKKRKREDDVSDNTNAWPTNYSDNLNNGQNTATPEDILQQKIKNYVGTDNFKIFFLEKHPKFKKKTIFMQWLFDFMRKYSQGQQLTVKEIAIDFNRTNDTIQKRLNTPTLYIAANKLVTPYVYCLNDSEIQTLIADYEKTLPQTTTDASQTNDTSSNTEPRSRKRKREDDALDNTTTNDNVTDFSAGEFLTDNTNAWPTNYSDNLNNGQNTATQEDINRADMAWGNDEMDLNWDSFLKDIKEKNRADEIDFNSNADVAMEEKTTLKENSSAFGYSFSFFNGDVFDHTNSPFLPNDKSTADDSTNSQATTSFPLPDDYYTLDSPTLD